jgi:hypothetical protein
MIESVTPICGSFSLAVYTRQLRFKITIKWFRLTIPIKSLSHIEIPPFGNLRAMAVTDEILSDTDHQFRVSQLSDRDLGVAVRRISELPSVSFQKL